MIDEGKTLLRTILNRLKEAENVKYDKELAVPLKVAERTVNTWKNRDSIPWERLFEYSRRKKVSLEWIINGRGPLLSTNMVTEEGAIYHVETDQDVVYDIAAQLHAALQGREIPADKFSQALKMLHRESIATGQPPAVDKVTELVKLL